MFWLVALISRRHAARQHQDGGHYKSEFYAERRHRLLQSKVLRLQRQPCAPNATILLSALSSKSTIIPVLRCLSRDAGGCLCLFCRKFLGSRLIFGQVRHAAESSPRRRHRIAANRHEALARIGLIPLGRWHAFRPGVPHVLGVRPRRILVEKGNFRRSFRPAGKRGLDRPGQTDAAEDLAVEGLAGIAVPTREDMQEIEISSRLYVENGARYMTASLMCAADTEVARITPVTFILSGHRLVTVRYDMPMPFPLVENKLARSAIAGINGETVLLELLDAVIDRCADILERAGADVGRGQPCHLRARGRGAHRPRQALFRHPDRDRPQGRFDLQGAREPGLDRPPRHLHHRRGRQRQMVEGHARAAQDHAAATWLR